VFVYNAYKSVAYAHKVVGHAILTKKVEKHCRKG